MGEMRFQVPKEMDERTSASLSAAYVAGLPDYMPWPTKSEVQNNELVVTKETSESASLYLSWPIQPASTANNSWLAGDQPRRLITGTATLGERPEPYHLLVELARGKVNQVRNQAADWQGAGLTLPEQVLQGLRACSLGFARAVCQPNSTTDADRLGLEAMTTAFQTGDQLIEAYVEHVLKQRKNQSGKVPFYLSCALEAPLNVEAELEFLSVFNAVRIPFIWRDIEPRESSYQWERSDALLSWCKQRQLPIEGGPIIDLASSRLPSWLESSKGDAQAIANLMLDYLEAILGRYKREIAFWTIMANAHDPSLLGIDEEEMLWLNAQLLAAAKQIYPEGRFALSLSQPWAENLASGERAYSAFLFADALQRSRVELTALNLEFAIGWSNRGSMLRDFLEVSRMLDLYALLGLPLTIYLSVPSASTPLQRADKDYPVADDGNDWSHELQRSWALRMISLAACKPYMLSLSWLHWSDAADHLFAHGGIVDGRNKVKPLLQALRDFSQAHLQPP
jgi:hypothetical protein